MKIFKVLALLLVLSLGLGMFAACSNGDVKDKTAASSAPAKEDNASDKDSEPAPEGNASTDIDESNNDDKDGEASEDESADKPVPTIIAKDNGDGTVTVSAKLPSGIGNGLIVITTSDNLVCVAGSAKSDIGIINDTGAFNGVGASFATATFFDEGTTAISVDYKLADGTTLSEDDFWCDYWELGDGTVWLSKKGEAGCEELKIKR